MQKSGRMAIEHGHDEDAFPIEHRNFPLPCLFTQSFFCLAQIQRGLSSINTHSQLTHHIPAIYFNKNNGRIWRINPSAKSCSRRNHFMAEWKPNLPVIFLDQGFPPIIRTCYLGQLLRWLRLDIDLTLIQNKTSQYVVSLFFNTSSRVNDLDILCLVFWSFETSKYEPYTLIVKKQQCQSPAVPNRQHATHFFGPWNYTNHLPNLAMPQSLKGETSHGAVSGGQGGWVVYGDPVDCTTKLARILGSFTPNSGFSEIKDSYFGKIHLTYGNLGGTLTFQWLIEKRIQQVVFNFNSKLSIPKNQTFPTKLRRVSETNPRWASLKCPHGTRVKQPICYQVNWNFQAPQIENHEPFKYWLETLETN